MNEMEKRAQAVRAMDALLNAINPERVKEALHDYELTHDHNHGRGSLRPGAPCPGDDCTVARARRVIAAMEAAQDDPR